MIIIVIWACVSTPEIHFPITVTERQEKALVQLEIIRDKKRKVEQMMTEENCKLRKVVKKLKKANEKYQHFTAMAADSSYS